jgi:hypothetical protein
MWGGQLHELPLTNHRHGMQTEKHCGFGCWTYGVVESLERIASC